jgi:predicted NUDIX family NTP pyrophosphohydrolase
MPKQSSGILPFRRKAGKLEVFLIHPGGPFWAKKGTGAWSIPKGEINAGEDTLAAAKREFNEETGHTVRGILIQLDPIKQRGGKIVHAWAVETDIDHTNIKSNSFEMIWPPKSGRMVTFPEVDKANWFEINKAREMILPGQLDLLDQLERKLKK